VTSCWSFILERLLKSVFYVPDYTNCTLGISVVVHEPLYKSATEFCLVPFGFNPRPHILLLFKDHV